MTVASQSIRADYTGSGTTGPFTFAFPCFNISTLEVITTDLSGNDTVLVLNVGFTAVGIKAPSDFSQGGTLTLTSNLTSGYHLAIVSDEPGTQNTSIKSNSQYYAYLHENEFDQLSLFDLQQLEKSNKSLVARDSEPAGTANLTLPSIANRAGMILGFDASGNTALYSQAGGGAVLITGLSFSMLPPNYGNFALAMTTDGVFAFFNPVDGIWEKVGVNFS